MGTKEVTAPDESAVTEQLMGGSGTTRGWISGPHKDRTRNSPHQDLPRCGPGMGGEGGDQTDRAAGSPESI